MPGFIFEKLDLEGAYLIENFHVGDNRGGFTKNFEKSIYRENGIEFNLDEAFASVSAQNVIRGLHFQLKHPQAKLVCVMSGSVWDVIVDLRKDSKTYKEWRAFELSAENGKALYVPRGFGHGFLSKENGTVMLYLCDGKYSLETDTGIRFDDPDLNIDWPADLSKTIHSNRDLGLLSFKEYELNPIEVI